MTYGPSILEAFPRNLANLPVDSLGRQHAYDIIGNRNKEDLCKAEKVKPAILDQLDKQYKQRFYNFVQHIVSPNLQISFTAGSGIVHRRDLPAKSVNHQELKGHLFEVRFQADMEIHIQ